MPAIPPMPPCGGAIIMPAWGGRQAAGAGRQHGKCGGVGVAWAVVRARGGGVGGAVVWVWCGKWCG